MITVFGGGTSRVTWLLEERGLAPRRQPLCGD